MAEGLIVRRAPSRGFDFDAAAYIAAVEEADGQALEPEIRLAYNRFVLGCKDDGIWDAIKASCIMAGARTLEGALVPLVGDAPTNFNFVSGDYNRKTGLVGDGSTKSLDANFAEQTPPNANRSLSVFITEPVTSLAGAPREGVMIIGTGTAGAHRATSIRIESGFVPGLRCQSSNFGNNPFGNLLGFAGASRDNVSNFTARGNGESAVSFGLSAPFALTGDLDFALFSSSLRQAGTFSDARLAFYSIGEALDLEKLDNRISNLITAIDVALS